MLAVLACEGLSSSIAMMYCNHSLFTFPVTHVKHEHNSLSSSIELFGCHSERSEESHSKWRFFAALRMTSARVLDGEVNSVESRYLSWPPIIGGAGARAAR